MRLKQVILAVLMMVVPCAVLAQNAQQELNDQFWEAVRRGDVAAVTTLLDKGVDVNAKFPQVTVRSICRAKMAKYSSSRLVQSMSCWQRTQSAR